MGCILLPPDRVGHTASIAQQIGVPVLATTHPAILRLETANAALHVVIGAGKVLPVVALHQVLAAVPGAVLRPGGLSNLRPDLGSPPGRSTAPATAATWKAPVRTRSGT